MNNTFNFDLDKVNCMEQVANVFGALVVATIKLKDMDIPNDDILPILRSLLGVDIEPTSEHIKDIPNILDMVKVYATFQHKDINTAIEELLAIGRKK